MSAFPTPTAVLPHRPPFLFVDEVTALVPGHSGTDPEGATRRTCPRPTSSLRSRIVCPTRA